MNNTAVRFSSCDVESFRTIRLAIKTVRKMGTSHFDSQPGEAHNFTLWECLPYLCDEYEYPGWRGSVSCYRTFAHTDAVLERLLNALPRAAAFRLARVSITSMDGSGILAAAVKEGRYSILGIGFDDAVAAESVATRWRQLWASMGHVTQDQVHDTTLPEIPGLEFQAMCDVFHACLAVGGISDSLHFLLAPWHEDYVRCRPVLASLSPAWTISTAAQFPERFDPFRRPKKLPADGDLRIPLYSAGGDPDKLLAQIDVVHSRQGSFLEVQSSRGLKWMEEFLKIKGVPAYEVWEGEFCQRWRTDQ